MRRTALIAVACLVFVILLLPSQALSDRTSTMTLLPSCNSGAPYTGKFSLRSGEKVVEIYDINISYFKGTGTCTGVRVDISGGDDDNDLYYTFRVNDTETIYEKFKEPIKLGESHVIGAFAISEVTCDCAAAFASHVVIHMSGKIK